MLKRMILLAALLVMLSALAVPASAASNGNTQIDGVGNFIEVCGGETSIFTLAMEGSLEGCWYTTDINWDHATPSGVYMERGTETFVGCLVEDGDEVACGSFSTTYKFTAKFAPDGSEIHGRCAHPIVTGSGTGGFAGATGRVDFKDDVDTGEFFYRGHVKLAS